MKYNNLKYREKMKKMLLFAVCLVCAAGLKAQKSAVAEKEIVGVWLMESMQWDGEQKKVCGKEMGYTQFKFYGPDGEYACAGIAMGKDGECMVMPQEYGTYSLRDGWYMEMGRKPLKDAVVLTDKNTYVGHWYNRRDVWKKQRGMSDKLVQYIVTCCKMKDTPSDIQQLMRREIFK